MSLKKIAALLADKKVRTVAISKLNDVLTEHKSSAVFTCSIIPFIVYMMHTFSEPSQPFVKELFLLVLNVGTMSFMLVSLVLYLFKCFITRDFTRCFYRYFTQVMVGIFIITSILWGIGQAGDYVYELALQNIENSALAVVFLFLLMSVFAINRMFFFETGYKVINAESAIGLSPLSVPRKITNTELVFNAAHEAGHAFIHAALGSIPDHVEVVIKTKAGQNENFGFVVSAFMANQAKTKQAMEWFMVTFLAGLVAEDFLTGNNTLGSRGDNSRWTEIAKDYLANNFEGIFYHEPQNEFEQKHNNERLQALHDSQIKILHAFFETNKAVLTDLYEKLLEKKTLSKNDLIPFLSKAEIPEDFPKPLGDFERFTDTWEEKEVY